MIRWSKVSGIFSITILILFASNTISSAFSDEEISVQLKNNLQDDANLSFEVEASDKRSTYAKILEKTQREGKVRVIVELATDFQPEGKLAALNDKMNQREKIQDIQERLLEKMLKNKPELLHKFKFIPFMALNVDKNSLEQLSSSPLVKSIQEDIAEPATLSDSTGIVGANPESFNLGYGGEGQAVVILDTGVEKSHDFLSEKVVSEACYSTTNGGTSKSFSVCPGGAQSSTAVNSGLPCSVDGCYHGTHVAGIASGNAGISGAPTSGVAKDSKIISIQVFSRFTKGSDCGGSPPCVLSWTSDQISALERVLQLHNDPNFTYDISSVNLSLGGGAYLSESACDADNVARKTAVDNLRSVGIATIASSGNSHYADAMGAPACISTVVSVGATNKSPETVPSFSNSASFLDLLAPGVSIRSSLTGNSYGELSGTSMAAPHVAGAWAILKQFDNQATVDEVLSALKNSGMPINDSGSGIITPRIQINKALDNDGDGVDILTDNCPNTSNPGQEDTDVDDIGNVCDTLPSEPNKQCVNQTGNWNNVNSWFPVGIPSSSKRLVMNNCDLTVESGETVIVGNILDVDSSSILNLDGDMTITGQVNLAGTTNVNSNTLRVSGTYNIQTGGIHNNNVNGITTVRSGGMFDVQSGGIVNDAGTHTTRGGGTTTVSGQWNEQGSQNTVTGTFNVESGGIYDNESSALTRILSSGNFNVQSGGIVNDVGTHTTRGGGTTTVSGQWNEQGSQNTVTGTFNVASGGVYDNESSALTRILSDGNFNLQTFGKVNNPGTFKVLSGGTATLDDDYDNITGGTTINVGTMNLDCNGLFNDLGGIFSGNALIDICLMP